MTAVTLLPIGKLVEIVNVCLWARWPYHFVLESRCVGTSRRDLDSDLRRRGSVCMSMEKMREVCGGGREKGVG